MSVSCMRSFSSEVKNAYEVHSIKVRQTFLTLGPLYTMAKGCDHEIVRALETHPKAIPWETEIELLPHSCGLLLPNY